MVRSDYEAWLERQGYAENTRAAQMHRVGKVEQAYGSLDEMNGTARFHEIIEELTYSAEDERRGCPNNSRLVFNGNIRNNLAAYKNAAVRYARFLDETRGVSADASISLAIDEEEEALPERQKLSLERDMQAALRRDISALSSDLKIVDDGTERSVSSGFIDVLCEDSSGALVVVELKAGKTDARVVGQILGYMGDLIVEGDTEQVRGIIVAHEFDKRTVSAARAIPNLKLVTYSISFTFEALT